MNAELTAEHETASNNRLARLLRNAQASVEMDRRNDRDASAALSNLNTRDEIAQILMDRGRDDLVREVLN